jgi:hypothetical protein
VFSCNPLLANPVAGELLFREPHVTMSVATRCLQFLPLFRNCQTDSIEEKVLLFVENDHVVDVAALRVLALPRGSSRLSALRDDRGDGYQNLAALLLLGFDPAFYPCAPLPGRPKSWSEPLN